MNPPTDRLAPDASPRWSSGPTAKPPGWLEALGERAVVAGRSHHSLPAQRLVREVCRLLATQLSLPSAYRIALVPGSASGAMEALLWSLLGPRPVDVVAYETFGRRWHEIVRDRLALQHPVRLVDLGWANVPRLAVLDPASDAVVVINGTVAGARHTDLSEVASSRQGILVADISSAAFCMDLDWSRIDAAGLGFQKALGAEPQYGAVILSPRAAERSLAGPYRSVPRLMDLRLLLTERSHGSYSEPVGTPSALVMADLLHSLLWLARSGGLPFAIARTEANFRIASDFITRSQVLDFAVSDPLTRSPTPLCIRLRHGAGSPALTESRLLCEVAAARVEGCGGGTDILAYSGAPPGFRLWCGPTVESADLLFSLQVLESAVVELLSSPEGRRAWRT